MKAFSFVECQKIHPHTATLNREIKELERNIGRVVYEYWSEHGNINVNMDEPIQEFLRQIGQKQEVL